MLKKALQVKDSIPPSFFLLRHDDLLSNIQASAAEDIVDNSKSTSALDLIPKTSQER